MLSSSRSLPLRPLPGRPVGDNARLRAVSPREFPAVVALGAVRVYDMGEAPPLAEHYWIPAPANLAAAVLPLLARPRCIIFIVGDA